MHAPFNIQCDGDFEDLYLFFSGLNDDSNDPVFEFARSTREFPARKIYIRDPLQLWYQAGFPGISTDLNGSVQYLRDLVYSQGATRVVACGNSMGGYAALLFGSMLGVHEVHAFSPRSFISPAKRLLYLDIGLRSALLRRNTFLLRRIWALARYPANSPRLQDLKNVLSDPIQQTHYHLHYAESNWRDRLHCQRLAALPHVNLHPYDYKDHDLVRHLQYQGALKEAIGVPDQAR